MSFPYHPPLLRPVIWSKGTLLTPQQLQLQDRFLESILGFHLDALSFQPWGFTRLEVIRTRDSVALSHAAGIFPDGLAFSMKDPDPLPEPCQVVMDKQQTSAEIYLSIPGYQAGGVNVSPESLSQEAKGRSPARYLSARSVVHDELSPKSEKTIEIARKNFRLLVSERPPDGCVSMPVARVVRVGTSIEVDPQFIPPLLDIECSGALKKIVGDLLQLMTAKSAELRDLRSERNAALAEFTAADIPNYWLLYTINSHLPQLRHILETRKGHPSKLFDIMVSMAGSLTTFSSVYQPRNLPHYDHADLTGCFRQLDEVLQTLLQTMGKLNFFSLPFKSTRPFVYETTLDEEKYFANTQIYLAVAADVPKDELIRRVPTHFRISSADGVETLRAHGLPGDVSLTHSESPPTIPVKTKYQYFSLRQSGEHWKSITRTRNLAVYVPSEFGSPQMQLWIVLPS